MKTDDLSKRVKGLFQELKTRLPSRSLQGKMGLTQEPSPSLAYRLIGKQTEHILPLFTDLDSNLQRAGLKINFKAYISLVTLTTITVSLMTMIFVPCLLALLLNVPVLPAVLFGIGGSLFAVACTIIGFYTYPTYRAAKVKRELEDELLFTTSYMSILASAGVSPEKIFYSISNLSTPLTATEEAKDVVRDVNLFGLDIISALQRTSRKTPSQKFKEMLEGFISTIHSGGDLATYLHGKSREYMKLKTISLRKFSDTLSILSEFYVAILVTGPLLLIIMLSVMAMLGGGNLGTLSPDLLLSMVTYLGLPLGSIMFLVILEAISPKW